MYRNDSYDALGYVIILIGVLISVILVSPIITIWALNTVFSLDIQTNIWTYLAVLWLTGLVAGSNIKSK